MVERGVRAPSAALVVRYRSMGGVLPDERPQRRREYSGAGSTLGLALLVVLTVGLAIWYFQVRGGNGSGGAVNGDYGIVELPAGLNPTGKDPAAQEGRAAPGFELPGIGGSPVRLDAFRGKYVLLNFWATWCPPCRAETPELQQFYETNAADGWVVIGINQQESPEQASGFLEKFGVTYPQALDLDGEVSNGYRVGRGLPVTILVDPEGVVREIHPGRITMEQLEQLRAEYGG